MKSYFKNNTLVIYCQKINLINNETDIITSKYFKKVIKKFLKTEIYKYEENVCFFYDLYKNDLDILLINFLNTINSTLKDKNLMVYKEKYLVIFKNLFLYWTNLEKYLIIDDDQKYSEIEISNNINLYICQTYFKLLANINNKEVYLLKNENFGFNAIIRLSSKKISLPVKYNYLENIDKVDKILINFPFIVNSTANKREGVFQETDKLNLSENNFEQSRWISYCLKVGSINAFIYFHIKYITLATAVMNLFELNFEQQFNKEEINIICIFGIENSIYNKPCFYKDLGNVYIGLIPDIDGINYFGYIKKMLLTLFNLIMINQGALPIHGAMFKVTLNNNIEKNIVLMGDSGTGKSEIIEAFRSINQKLKSIDVIFDDMGVFKIEKEVLNGYGTEIGAFVRLDDLDNGYALSKVNNSIFFGTDKANARAVLSFIDYNFIIKPHPVDIFLYANNYENKEGIEILNRLDLAKEIFKRGRRKAKMTTNEVGIVDTYFANPFGPYQSQDIFNNLIELYFKFMSENKIVIGEIYTKLALEGQEKKGPLNAAKEIIKLIEK